MHEAFDNGAIDEGRVKTQSSRIGGTQIKDYILHPPTDLEPYIPGAYNQTAVAALDATVHHNQAGIGVSSRLLLLLDDDADPTLLSTIISDPNFTGRPFDVLWCACKSY